MKKAPTSTGAWTRNVEIYLPTGETKCSLEQWPTFASNIAPPGKIAENYGVQSRTAFLFAAKSDDYIEAVAPKLTAKLEKIGEL